MADTHDLTEPLQECQRGKGKHLAALLPELQLLSPCGGAFPPVLGWRLGTPADSLGAGLPGGLRVCAASCQGQLGKQSEQRGHPLHGQGL